MKEISRIAALITSMSIACVTHAQIGQVAPLPQIDKSEISGPTLEETQEWLTTKVRSVGVRSISGMHPQRHDIYFSGCKMYNFITSKYLNNCTPGYECGGGYGYRFTVSDLTEHDLEQPRYSLGGRDVFKKYPQYTDDMRGVNYQHLAAAYDGDLAAVRAVVEERMKNTRPELSSYNGPEFPAEDLTLRGDNALRQAIKHCLKIDKVKAVTSRPVGVKPPGEKF